MIYRTRDWLLLALIALILASGCASSKPSVTASEKKVYVAGQLASESRRVVVVAPAHTETPPSIKTTRDGLEVQGASGDNNPPANLEKGRNWLWTLVVGIPGALLVVWSAWLFHRGGWKTASIYPAAFGVALLIFTFTLQTYPWVYTALIVGAAVIGGVALFLHIRYAYFRGAKSLS